MNLKKSHYLTEQTEFLSLQNVDCRIVGSLSSFAGNTAYTTQSATSQITGVAYFSSYFTPPGSRTLATDRYHLSDISGGTFASVFNYTLLNNASPFSFLGGQSVIFGTNGTDSFHYPGASVNSSFLFSLPKPYLYQPGFGPGGSSAGIYGYFVLYYALVRSDGFIGPAINATYLLGGSTFVSFTPPKVPLGIFGGVSTGSWGVSGIQVWYSLSGGTFGGAQSQPLGLTYLLGFSTPVGGFTIGVGLTGFALTTPQPEDFQGTFYFGLGSEQGSSGNNISGTGCPNVIETFNNQLFSAGFVLKPSRVVFSDIGQYERSAYENFFDVSPAEPGGVIAMKTYFTQLMVLKTNSIWTLSGTDIDNYTLSQISGEYGGVSKLAVCVWNQRFWFLDRSGICEFNGANIQTVSNKMQPYFDRMNLNVPPDTAIMLHVKERNEVWCAIPIDGATRNNIIIVYDYLADSWMTRSTPQSLSMLNVLTLDGNKQSVYYGTFSGTVGNFGNSFIGDNGAAFTSVIQSRFNGDMGHSVEKMFRRLYMDAVVSDGSTFNVAVNLYTNQGSSAAYQTTMTISANAIQNRIDFGLAAKDLSVEFIYNGDKPLLLNGYTIEYRFQRAVSSPGD